jgi:hypothetical protein
MTDSGGEDLEQLVRAMTERRKRDPLGFLVEVLKGIWLESDENDVEFLWRHRLRNAPWWAENALLAFEAVLADPPGNLCDLIEEHAGRGVSDDGLMYGGQSCLAWLASQLERLRAIRP